METSTQVCVVFVWITLRVLGVLTCDGDWVSCLTCFVMFLSSFSLSPSLLVLPQCSLAAFAVERMEVGKTVDLTVSNKL